MPSLTLPPPLADLDGDGDPDIVAAHKSSEFRYFENDGTDAEPEFILPEQLGGPAALTLYDTGGSDTLDLRTDRDDQRIDLRPEGISDVYGLIGNLVIARDVLIENVVAGHGNDVVIGNTAVNRLEGRAGDDVPGRRRRRRHVGWRAQVMIMLITWIPLLVFWCACMPLTRLNTVRLRVIR